MRRNLAYVIGIVAIILFLAAAVGMFSNGSFRWVEPLEQAGLILFVGVVMLLYLIEDDEEYREAGRSSWLLAGWSFGVVAVALFLVAIISNLAVSQSVQPRWIEAVEVVGELALLALIIAAVYGRGVSRGGR